MWLKEVVTKLINKFSSNNPFEIASHLNIHVIEWDLHKEINGTISMIVVMDISLSIVT